MPVRNLKKGEYGRVLYFNAGEALQSAGPTVEFIRPTAPAFMSWPR